MNGEDYEDRIEDLILENGMLTQALLNLLIAKGILTQEELAGEVEKLYGNAEEGELPLGGLAEFRHEEDD
jgi:hypothetical protein